MSPFFGDLSIDAFHVPRVHALCTYMNRAWQRRGQPPQRLSAYFEAGSHSVGVQRQYTGSAGKITNCQVGVSLSVASRTEHIPIDFALYLPTWRDGTRGANVLEVLLPPGRRGSR